MNVLVDSKWRRGDEIFYTYWKRTDFVNILRIESFGRIGDECKIIKRLMQNLCDEDFNITAPDLRCLPTFKQRKEPPNE